MGKQINNAHIPSHRIGWIDYHPTYGTTHTHIHHCNRNHTQCMQHREPKHTTTNIYFRRTRVNPYNTSTHESRTSNFCIFASFLADITNVSESHLIVYILFSPFPYSPFGTGPPFLLRALFLFPRILCVIKYTVSEFQTPRAN